MERKYKTPDNKVHQIDEDFVDLLPAGSVEITDAEAAVILSPAPSLAQVKSSKIAALDALLGDWKTPRIALANGAGKPKITFTGADQIQVVILAWLGLTSGGGASVILTDVDGNSGTVTKSLLDSFVPLWVAEHNRVRSAYAQRKSAIDAASTAAEVAAVDTSNPL